MPILGNFLSFFARSVSHVLARFRCPICLRKMHSSERNPRHCSNLDLLITSIVHKVCLSACQPIPFQCPTGILRQSITLAAAIQQAQVYSCESGCVAAMFLSINSAELGDRLGTKREDSQNSQVVPGQKLRESRKSHPAENIFESQSLETGVRNSLCSCDGMWHHSNHFLVGHLARITQLISHAMFDRKGRPRGRSSAGASCCRMEPL